MLLKTVEKFTIKEEKHTWYVDYVQCCILNVNRHENYLRSELGSAFRAGHIRTFRYRGPQQTVGIFTLRIPI